MPVQPNTLDISGLADILNKKGLDAFKKAFDKRVKEHRERQQPSVPDNSLEPLKALIKAISDNKEALEFLGDERGAAALVDEYLNIIKLNEQVELIEQAANIVEIDPENIFAPVKTLEDYIEMPGQEVKQAKMTVQEINNKLPNLKVNKASYELLKSKLEYLLNSLGSPEKSYFPDLKESLISKIKELIKFIDKKLSKIDKKINDLREEKANIRVKVLDNSVNPTLLQLNINDFKAEFSKATAKFDAKAFDTLLTNLVQSDKIYHLDYIAIARPAIILEWAKSADTSMAKSTIVKDTITTLKIIAEQKDNPNLRNEVMGSISVNGKLPEFTGKLLENTANKAVQNANRPLKKGRARRANAVNAKAKPVNHVAQQGKRKPAKEEVKERRKAGDFTTRTKRMATETNPKSIG